MIIFELIQIYLREDNIIQTYIFLEMCLSKINKGFSGFSHLHIFRFLDDIIICKCQNGGGDQTTNTFDPNLFPVRELYTNTLY